MRTSTLLPLHTPVLIRRRIYVVMYLVVIIPRFFSRALVGSLIFPPINWYFFVFSGHTAVYVFDGG